MLRILLFQILHMTSQKKKHVTKSRKLTLALIMRPLIVTKKMATVGTSFVLSGIGPEYFWLWCQSDPEWPPQDSNLGDNALTPGRYPPGTIRASCVALLVPYELLA